MKKGICLLLALGMLLSLCACAQKPAEQKPTEQKAAEWTREGYYTDENDNMLIVVLAYQDKGVRVEIGHELEKRISEVECQELLNKILIPFLREEDPNEGMLSLVEAMYHKIEDKQ